MKRLPFLVLATWLFSACSGSSFSCVGMTPIPAGTFEGPRTDDPVQARISARGFATLNAQQQKLLAILAPGATMQIPVPCTVQQNAILGQILIADQGSFGCTTESCGLMDGVCTSADLPANIPVTFTNLKLNPSPPNAIAATVDVQFSTGKLYVDSVNRSHALCFLSGGGPVKCGVDYMTTRVPPLDNQIVATIELTADTAFSQRIAMNLKKVDGLAACGAPGSLPTPQCTDRNDLVLTPETGGCCPGSQSNFVKDLLLTFLAGELKKQLQQTVETQTCEPCPFGGCPVEEDGGTPSTCDFARGICTSASLNRCAPRKAGVEGRLDPAALLTGMQGSAQVDLTLMLAHHAAANTGLDLGSRGGALAVGTSECVPVVAEAAFATSSPVNFDAQSDAGYEFGLSISRGYLDRLGHGLHQSGGFCGTVNTASFAQVNTGLLRPFLPSLGALLGDQDVPMRLLLRPQVPPTFTPRAGTFDPNTNAVIEPLLNINLKDFRIEFHALMEDRYVRLFSATLDAVLPVSLLPNGCGEVLPVIGNLDNVISNVRFTDSEIVAENLDTALGPLLPAVIAFARPQLTGNLAALSLPPMGPFKLRLLEARGVNAIGNGDFDHAALFARIVPVDECLPAPPPSLRSFISSVNLGAQPAVSVQLERPIEASFRVDEGMWSTFHKTDGVLVVKHPSLMLQGRHRIDVRVKEHGEDASALLPSMFATIDLQAPSVRLIRDNGRIVAKTYDSLTPAAMLTLDYRFGAGEWVRSAGREFSAAQLDRDGSLSVRVTDEAGRSSAARITALTTAERAETVDDVTTDDPNTGCAAASGGPLLLLALAFLARRRSL